MNGLDSRIFNEIRAGKICNPKPFRGARLCVFEIERTAAILTEALFCNTRRKRFKLALRINHFGSRLESNPCHECCTMKPLALNAVAMSSPKRRKRRLKFHLAAITSAFSVFHVCTRSSLKTRQLGV